MATPISAPRPAWAGIQDSYDYPATEPAGSDKVAGSAAGPKLGLRSRLSGVTRSLLVTVGLLPEAPSLQPVADVPPSDAARAISLTLWSTQPVASDAPITNRWRPIYPAQADALPRVEITEDLEPPWPTLALADEPVDEPDLVPAVPLDDLEWAASYAIKVLPERPKAAPSARLQRGG